MGPALALPGIEPSGREEALRFRKNAGHRFETAAGRQPGHDGAPELSALHPAGVVGGGFKTPPAAGRGGLGGSGTALRPAPTRYPPGTWRVVSGSQVASSGHATSTATIRTMIRNIGRAVFAM